MSSFQIYNDAPQEDQALESIYNLLPKTVTLPEKKPMHKSKHNPLAPIKYSTLNQKGPNLGIKTGKNDKSQPGKFLRASTPSKRNPLKPLDNVAKFSYKNPLPRKPRVPNRSERPVMSLHSKKNYITANAVEAILAVPKQQEIDEADYLKKADYGKVPKYLKQVKAEINAENELIDSYVANQMKSYEDAPEMCEELDEEERLTLIEKLKTKWEAINKQYQKLCMHTQYEGHHKERKERYEKEMDEVEQSLDTLSRGPVMISQG